MTDVQYLGYYELINTFTTNDGERIRTVTLYLARDGPNAGAFKLVLKSTNNYTRRLEGRVTLMVY